MKYLKLLKDIFTYNLYTDSHLNECKVNISNDIAKINIDDISIMKDYIIDDGNSRLYEKFSINFVYKNNLKNILQYKNHGYPLGMSINLNGEICLYTNADIFNGDSIYTIDFSRYKEDKEKVYIIDESGNVICGVDKIIMNDKDKKELFIKITTSILEFVINNNLKV